MEPRKPAKATIHVETAAKLNFACHQSSFAYLRDLRIENNDSDSGNSLFEGDFALSIIGGRRNNNKLSSALRPIEAKRVQFEDSMETGEMES